LAQAKTKANALINSKIKEALSKPDLTKDPTMGALLSQLHVSGEIDDVESMQFVFARDGLTVIPIVTGTLAVTLAPTESALPKPAVADK
jgi:hypothetical protein